MNLWSRRKMVSIIKLKFQPRIIFVSERPPSTSNLSFANIVLRSISLFALSDWVATSIARGIAASNRDAFLVPGMLTVSPSEEPIFDLTDFFVLADPIYCFKIHKLTFPTNIWFHKKINVLVVLCIWMIKFTAMSSNKIIYIDAFLLNKMFLLVLF